MFRSPVLKFMLALWPLLEIAGFILVGKLIGVMPTLLLILASTGLGVLLLRRQGLKTLEQSMHRTRGGAPMQDLLSGPAFLLAGILLLIPGFITSIIGLLILIPGLRQAAITSLLRNSQRQQKAKSKSPYPEDEHATKSSRVIEGEFWREDSHQPGQDETNKKD